MKTYLLTLPVIILLSCGAPNKSDMLSSDSTATTKDSVITSSPAVVETPVATNLSTPVEGAQGADSLFNLLVRKKIVRGAFGDVTVLTTKLIDSDNLNTTESIIAVLIHSGEGEGYNTQFATEYTVLTAFKLQGDQVTLIDYVDLGEATSHGLQESGTDGDSVMLTVNKFAARVHYRSSEEGAGDSGYRHESTELYVLLNGKLAKIFENDVEDFSFASNEVDSFRETTTTTTFKVLPEMSKGLFNLYIETSTTSKGSEDNEQENKESESQDGDRRRDGTYQWNGKMYEWVRE